MRRGRNDRWERALEMTRTDDWQRCSRLHAAPRRRERAGRVYGFRLAANGACVVSPRPGVRAQGMCSTFHRATAGDGSRPTASRRSLWLEERPRPHPFSPIARRTIPSIWLACFSGRCTGSARGQPTASECAARSREPKARCPLMGAAREREPGGAGRSTRNLIAIEGNPSSPPR